jgi:hypothetical protein
VGDKDDDVKKVPNTTQEVLESREGGMAFLAEAMLSSMSGEDPSSQIERQEARGQADMVNSTQLPVKGSPGSQGSTAEDEAAWAAMGIEFGPIDPNDIFRNAMLPEGWSKRPTDHSMWSDLVDDKGRKRAAIFYKAAFYDRAAHIHLERRFYVKRDYDRDDCETVVAFQVVDCGKVVFTTEAVEAPRGEGYDSPEWRHREKTEQRLAGEATAWVAERYPDWERLDAYWDDGEEAQKA